jgi:tripartite-type tricarboxylate transporter receptor subunit TctC
MACLQVSRDTSAPDCQKAIGLQKRPQPGRTIEMTYPAISRRIMMQLIPAVTCAVASVANGSRLFAQSWPDRPIRVISPITAGSAADAITRVVMEPVSAQLGQPIIVENRPGADGTIGSAAVARAEPDGYTVLSHSAAQTVVATIHPGLSYDTYRDFARVTPMAKIPSVLVIGASKNIHSVAELIAAARSRPVNFASPGAFTHLNTVRFLRSAGIEAQRIPFKGGPEALTEVTAGRVDFYFSPLFLAVPLIASGKVVALAVTGSRRTPLLPEVPTFAEVGFAKADDNFWIGLFVPAQTPISIIDRLHDLTAEAVRLPGVAEKFAKLGAEQMAASPEEFGRLVQNQIAENAALIKAAGIGAD